MGSIEDYNGTDFILGTSERTSGIVGDIVGVIRDLFYNIGLSVDGLISDLVATSPITSPLPQPTTLPSHPPNSLSTPSHPGNPHRATTHKPPNRMMHRKRHPLRPHPIRIQHHIHQPLHHTLHIYIRQSWLCPGTSPYHHHTVHTPIPFPTRMAAAIERIVARS